MKHSIEMNANSGIGSFELGQYFRLSLSFNKSNCALCEKYGSVTTEPIDWQADPGDAHSLQNRLNSLSILANNEMDDGTVELK